MNKVEKIKNGIITAIGVALSPVTPFNDLYVNVPLAYVFAVIFDFFLGHFLFFMLLGYWLTNIAGLVLTHRGFINVVSKEEKPYTIKDFIKDLFVSIIYTIFIVIIIEIGWLRPPAEYLKSLGY